MKSLKKISSLNFIEGKMMLGMLFLLLTMLFSCSSDSSVAGILIETNTGNKVLIETNTGNGFARVMISVDDFGISEGDTLQLSRTERDTVGDTIRITNYYTENIVNVADVALGYVAMDSVPAQDYDSLTILPVKGETRSIAIDLTAEEGKTYRIGNKGEIVNVIAEYFSGNSAFARFVYISVDDFNLKTMDSVQIFGQKETLYGDTLVINDCEFTMVADSPSVASGMLEGFFVPQGQYNKITITSGGKKRDVALNFELYDEGDFYLDSTGAKSVGVSFESVREGNASAYFSMEYSQTVEAGDTLRFSAPVSRKLQGDSILVVTKFFEHELTKEDIAAKTVFLEDLPEGYYEGFEFITKESILGNKAKYTLSKDKRVFVYSVGSENVESVTVTLPEGFEDLSSVDESFKDMPFPVRFEKNMSTPCLVDVEGEEILLEKSPSDSLLYWGRMNQVVFSKDGSIKFDLLNNCNRYKDSVTLARRVVHLDDKTPSENAVARFDKMDAAFGTALWQDSSDMWILINDFEPFTNNGTQVSASIWIKGDSASQAYLPENKNYTRILSCKKDSVGFILQQRADRPAVNMRIDAHQNGKGVYNTTYGNAQILDGTWHNYSFTIRGDSIYTYADGVKISANEFDSGEGFAVCTNPAIGYEKRNFVGGLDEIFFFDGSQTENWMRLFYALQKQAR